MPIKKIALLALIGTLIISSSACLQTRAQLRGEPSAHSESDRAEVPAVEGYQSVHVAPPTQAVESQGGYATDEVKVEITRLEGRVQDLERAQKDQQGSGDSTAALKEGMKKLEDRIALLETTQAELLESLQKIQTKSVPLDPQATFEKAMEHYQSDDFKEAVEEFTAYLQLPKPKKADEATFLRAESYFKLKDYKKAIVDYSKFPEHFKKSTHMAEALYKIGQCFDAMGMKEDAKGFYQELVEKHPKSSQAKKAKSKLR